MSSLLGHAQPPGKRPRFWLGPFIAGCCIAFGYGLTSRLISIQRTLPQPQMSFLKGDPFPGIASKSINLSGVNQEEDLNVELVTIEDRTETSARDPSELNATHQNSSKEQIVVSVLNPLKPRFAFPVLPSLVLDDLDLKLFFEQMIIQTSVFTRFIRVSPFSPIPFTIPQESQSLR